MAAGACREWVASRSSTSRTAAALTTDDADVGGSDACFAEEWWHSLSSASFSNSSRALEAKEGERERERGGREVLLVSRKQASARDGFCRAAKNTAEQQH